MVYKTSSTAVTNTIFNQLYLSSNTNLNRLRTLTSVRDLGAEVKCRTENKRGPEATRLLLIRSGTENPHIV